MDDPRPGPEASGATLSAPDGAAPAPLRADEAIDAWDRMARQLTLALRAEAPDAAWLESFRALVERVDALATRDADAAIYLLVQAAASHTERYAAHHALLCAVVGGLCADVLGWVAPERSALVSSALSMNLAMAELQNTLSAQATPLSEGQRERVRRHGEDGAERLAGAGLDDALWLAVVRHHHDPSAAGDEGTPARRLAELLHRIDVYTAKLSRRATRDGQSPLVAARQTCLGAHDRPDALGAAVLKVMGVYPPGCLVRLANDEVGVVVRRGALAHTPTVAVVRRADGGVCSTPPRRDTALAPNAVRQCLKVSEVKVRLNHLRVLQSA